MRVPGVSHIGRRAAAFHLPSQTPLMFPLTCGLPGGDVEDIIFVGEQMCRRLSPLPRSVSCRDPADLPVHHPGMHPGTPMKSLIRAAGCGTERLLATMMRESNAWPSLRLPQGYSTVTGDWAG